MLLEVGIARCMRDRREFEGGWNLLWYRVVDRIVLNVGLGGLEKGVRYCFGQQSNILENR